MTEDKHDEVEALCPECGHAFKTFMDRVLQNGNTERREEELSCPVCGCGKCPVGK